MKYVFLGILILPTIEDLKTREIRNLYSFLIVFLRCIQLFVEKDEDLIIDSIAGLFSAALIMLLCNLINKSGIGFGDVKLLISLGFALGIKLFLRGLLYVSLCSILFSIILLATNKAKKNTQLPFVPFVFVGMLIATLVEVMF